VGASHGIIAHGTRWLEFNNYGFKCTFDWQLRIATLSFQACVWLVGLSMSIMHSLSHFGNWTKHATNHNKCSFNEVVGKLLYLWKYIGQLLQYKCA
jgi:hypothetical protein